MRFISTRRQSRPVRLYEALRRSVAPDGGVYVPDSLPMLPEAFFNNFVEMSAPEIAYVVADMLMGEDVAPRREFIEENAHYASIDA